jgi:hypothetical protein
VFVAILAAAAALLLALGIALAPFFLILSAGDLLFRLGLFGTPGQFLRFALKNLRRNTLRSILTYLAETFSFWVFPGGQFSPELFRCPFE